MGQMKIEIGYSSSTSERLFMLYLFIAVCVILVRTSRMAWRLWSLRGKQEFSSWASHNAEKIGKAALKGLFEREPKPSQSENLSNLHFIETKFSFLWETYYAKVQSIKALAMLTAVLSFSVAAIGLCNICIGTATEADVGIAAVAGAARYVFGILAIGLLVSASFYAISLLFEETLAHRRRDWNFLRARLSEEFGLKEPREEGLQ